MTPIDLRSDTVTRPSPAMREAMARAPVGDDQYGEDPSVNALEERIAELLGKEAAVFVPSGTMANQIALRVMTRPGDEVIVGGEAHILWHETGAASALSGVQINVVGTSGVFDTGAFVGACKPRGHLVFPPTGMVVIENTHNRGGGIVFPQEDAIAVCAAADEKGVATYLDGARLFNVACATGLELKVLAAPFRMASVALSKGLGAPVGSVLAGSRDDMVTARRVRRLYGGAMRQSGILAAAGLYALDHNVARLAEDHKNARGMAEILSTAKGVKVDLATVQTNIVIFHLEHGALDTAALVAKARERCVLVSQFAPRTVRLTTHLDVTREQCEAAASRLAELLSAPQ